MPNQTRNLNPVAGALLAFTVVSLASPLLAVGGTIALLAAVPLAAFGATRFARPLAPVAVALVVGLLVGRFATALVALAALGPLISLPVFAVATLGTIVVVWRSEMELTMRIGGGFVTLPARPRGGGARR